MKYMRKILAMALAVMMVMSLAIGASADTETGTITIASSVEGKTYDLYKIFDLTYTGANTTLKVSYTIASAWEDFFSDDGASYIVTEDTGSLNAVVVDGVTMYINITDSNVAAFAKAAQAYAVSMDADRTVDGTGADLEVTDLALGYYLVYPQGATETTNSSICSLTSTTPSATVSIKATYPTIDKTDDKDSAAWGETVNYTITGKVPDTTGFTTYTYQISDTMSDGLTFNKNVTVTIGGTTFTPTAEQLVYTDTGFTLTIPVQNYQDKVGADIVVTYTATVNQNAVAEVEKNRAVLKYSNDPQNAQSFTETPADEEEVYSCEIVIDKVDGSGNKLAGAWFVLKDENGEYYRLGNDYKVTWESQFNAGTPVKTDDNGVAKFQGIAEGTYYLEEIQAPDGYNKLTDDIKVEVKASTKNEVTVYSVTTTVTNNAGSTLPSTGGMGTTLFYVIGAMLVLAAAILLITKRRMNVAE